MYTELSVERGVQSFVFALTVFQDGRGALSVYMYIHYKNERALFAVFFSDAIVLCFRTKVFFVFRLLRREFVSFSD
jgi:hypothetical protein